MGYRLEVLLSAEMDVAKAIEYYSKISETLAGKFLDVVESSYKILGINPYFQKKYGNIRTVPINGFPYLLFYTLNESLKTVNIISCFHTSQNPKKYPN